jgi:hypothetical protein
MASFGLGGSGCSKAPMSTVCKGIEHWPIQLVNSWCRASGHAPTCCRALCSLRCQYGLRCEAYTVSTAYAVLRPVVTCHSPRCCAFRCDGQLFARNAALCVCLLLLCCLSLLLAAGSSAGCVEVATRLMWGRDWPMHDPWLAKLAFGFSALDARRHIASSQQRTRFGRGQVLGSRRGFRRLAQVISAFCGCTECFGAPQHFRSLFSWLRAITGCLVHAETGPEIPAVFQYSIVVLGTSSFGLHIEASRAGPALLTIMLMACILLPVYTLGYLSSAACHALGMCAWYLACALV